MIALADNRVCAAVAKNRCENDHLFFTRYFFKHRQALKFHVNWHHQYIAESLQEVIDGITTNLVINVPPGSSKTEMAIINFIARGLAINPRARFLHLSSGEDLVLLNSKTARDLIQSEEYQQFWPLVAAEDAKAKKRWNVMVKGREAGGVYAVPLGGQITGFRAGHMAPGFQGAILADDLLKADDAFSKPEISKANRRLVSTVKSRRALATTPIVLIMQRLNTNDPTGFIQKGNLPGKWKYVIIPAIIDEAYINTLPPHIAELARESTKNSPRDNKGRFSYWEYKEPLSELLEMEKGSGTDADGNKINRFVFAAQYQQAPVALGGNIIRGEAFGRIPGIEHLPEIEYHEIFGDTAQKTEERHDYSVFEDWGKVKGKDQIVLLDMIRGKWEATDLKTRAKDFWEKRKAAEGVGTLRKMNIEDKASGTGLIQDIKKEGKIPIFAIQRNKDKLTRVMDVVSYIDSTQVWLIDGMAFNNDFISECEAFTADMTHEYDDQVDPLCDAIEKMISRRKVGFFNR